MMDQTVHVYILHPRFLWYTFFFSFFMRPLTLSSKLALTYSQLLSNMHSSILSLPISLSQYNHLILIPQLPWCTNIYLWLTTAFLSLEKSRNIWARLDLFLLVICFAAAPCCVHMGSPSHVEGRGAAYLCYWFSHWLRSSFGKWKHAVCRKRDLEMSACPKTCWYTAKKKIIWLLLQRGEVLGMLTCLCVLHSKLSIIVM